MPSVYGSLWLWILVLAIILIAVALIGYQANKFPTVPLWVWVLFVGGLLLILVSFALYASYKGLGSAVYDTVRTNPGWSQRAIVLPS